MDLIAIKDIGIELPKQKNIDNCIKYNKFFSIAFARDNVITVVKKLKADDYKDLIDFYELTEKDPILFCFQGYVENELGDMPLVVSKKNKHFDNKTFKTNKSVIAFADSVLGVKTEETDNFLSNIAKFDRNKFSDISKLVFGDNLVAILNSNGSFETYGLAITTTKKWKKSESGIIYTDDSFDKIYYGNCCNSYYYNSDYKDYYDYDYDYTDNNPTPYICDSCLKKTTFVILKTNKQLCSKCYNKTKGKVEIC